MLTVEALLRVPDQQCVLSLTVAQESNTQL